MKRCIICGNVGDDSSTTCEVCGNPYVDIEENASDTPGAGMYSGQTPETVSGVQEKAPVDGQPGAGMSAVYGSDEAAGGQHAAYSEDRAVSESGTNGAAQADSRAVPGANGAAQADSRVVSGANGAAQADSRVASGVNGAAQTDDRAVSGANSAAQLDSRVVSGANGVAQVDSRVASGANGAAQAGGAAQAQRRSAVGHPASGSAAAQGARPVHRMRSSGPQIYGQNGSQPSGAAYGQQGMVRRNVQGYPAGNSNAARPTQQAGAAQSRPTGYAANCAQGRPAGYSANGAQSRPAGYPASGAQGRPTGYPANGAQSRPAGTGQPRPVNGVQNARPAGYPAQGRPANMGVRPAMQSPGHHARQIAETARKMLGSPLFLLVALLHTAYLAGSVASVFMNQMNYSQAVKLIRSVPLPSQVSGYANIIISLLSKLDSGAIAVNLLLRLPDLLFCLGLWLIFIKARTAGETMSGIGFSFARVTVILNMIVSCVAMLAVLVVSVAVVIASWTAGTTSVIAMSAIVLVAVIVITMIVIMYHFCYLATLKTCRLNGSTGEEYGSLSAFVAVLHILLALFNVINLLSGIVNAEIANIVGAVGAIGWMLLFAVWIFMYRGKMEEFES